MTQTITTIGFIRRVRALAAMGHPNEDVARWLAVDEARVRRLQIRGSTSTRLKATLTTVFARERMNLGRCELTRLRARKAGWRTWMAWDDDTIDQPGSVVAANRFDSGYDIAEQAADDIIRRMSEAGQTEREIAEFLRMSRATIQRRRAALGLCARRAQAQ